MFSELEKVYLPEIDKVIERNFPDYAKKIKDIPLNKRKTTHVLSQKEILNLYNKYKNENDLYSRDLIIISQLKLVYLYAKKFHYSNNGTMLSEEDLLGFANLILLEIIDAYDPYTGKEGTSDFNNFSSYVRTWLEFNLHTEMKKYGLLVRMPTNRISEMAVQKKYISKYEQKYGEPPRHGDFLVFKENGQTKKVVFDYADEKMLFYEKNGDNFSFVKSVKLDESPFEIVSGNNIVCQDENEEAEYFDLMAGELDTSINDNEIISKSISNVLQTLSDRERRYIELFYIQKIPLKNIPSLIPPDIKNKNELKTLNKTSLNKIELKALTKNSEKVFIEYKVNANYHIEEGEFGQTIQCNLLKPLSHFKTNINTNKRKECFEFLIKEMDDINFDSIEIKHSYLNKSDVIFFNVKPSEEGFILSFEIEYNYGIIFTSQTFLNNNEQLIKKLRTKLIHLKKIVTV